MRYCLKHNNEFYNVFPEQYGELPIAKVELAGTLITYFDVDEAEGAKFSAYARIVEYDKEDCEMCAFMALIPELEVVPVDQEVIYIVEQLCLDMVNAYE